jgi:hypothetical protein
LRRAGRIAVAPSAAPAAISISDRSQVIMWLADSGSIQQCIREGA